MARFDGIGERIARRLARGSSRRSLLAKLGAAVVAAPLFPLLPVARAAAPTGPLTDFERNAQSKLPDIFLVNAPDRRCVTARMCVTRHDCTLLFSIAHSKSLT